MVEAADENKDFDMMFENLRDMIDFLVLKKIFQITDDNAAIILNSQIKNNKNYETYSRCIDTFNNLNSEHSKFLISIFYMLYHEKNQNYKEFITFRGLKQYYKNFRNGKKTI